MINFDISKKEMGIIKNNYIVKGEITEILIKSKTYGHTKTLIDTEDLPIAKQITGSWCLNYNRCTRSFYAMACIKKNNKWTTVALHRIILGLTDRNLCVDHIFHDTLDNRKSHLRIVTYSENQQNTRMNKNNTSGIKGVTWHKRDKRWKARIKVNQKYINLGSFNTKEEAKQAREIAEEKYFLYKSLLPERDGSNATT